jgi:hypothetical protein
MEQDQVYYIKVENGSVVGNPYQLSNLKLNGINPENDPNWVQHFPLIESKPAIINKRKETVEQVNTFDGKVSKTIWLVRKLTDEELANLPPNPIDTVKGNVPNVI